MLDPSRFTAPLAAAPSMTATAMRPVLRMQSHDRMAGSIPVWEKPRAPAAPAAQPETRLTAALTGEKTAQTPAPLAYTNTRQAPAASAAGPSTPAPFTFFDLLDMINPLQHIPLVSTLYRDLTGDEIKPVSRIIGGAVFGGPAGAAGSLANVIIEHETGKDLTGNVVALVRDGTAPQWRSPPDDPEQRLNAVLVAQHSAHNPATPAHAFTSTPYPAHPPAKPRYHAPHEDSRMAGQTHIF